MAIQIRGKLPNQTVNRTFHEVKGRSDYPCSVCRKTIPKGVKHYRYATFTSQGNARVHIECIQTEDKYKNAKKMTMEEQQELTACLNQNVVKAIWGSKKNRKTGD